MHLRPETSLLLAELQSFSGGRLTRVNDLGTLLELGQDGEPSRIRGELVFLAKFISRIHGIMQRIGPGGNGYDKLLGEFNEKLESCGVLLRDLLAGAPADDRAHFVSTYLAATPESLGNYLALLYDLSWYKNWELDHQQD